MPQDDDFERVIAMLSATAGVLREVHYGLLNWEPASKSRPRFGRGGRAYTPKESRAAELRTSLVMRRWLPTPLTGNVAMACIFFRPTRQRIDVDNMLKHVCDAANGVLWEDDHQVTSLAGVVELDRLRPRTLVAFAPHVTTMTRGTDATYPCEQCGSAILMSHQTKKRKTCSPDCASRLRGYEPLSQPVPCGECGKLFRRTTKAQHLCSPECRADRIRGSNKRRRATPPSECPDCGVTLTHNRGGRCRACWRAAVAKTKELT